MFSFSRLTSLSIAAALLALLSVSAPVAAHQHEISEETVSEVDVNADVEYEALAVPRNQYFRAALAAANPEKQVGVPDIVKVTGNKKVVYAAPVTDGIQIWECVAVAKTVNPSGFDWKNQAPFAFLKGDDGTNVIHSTDPTWLYTLDGSEVKAKVSKSTGKDGKQVDAKVIVDANSIPWLRLDVTQHVGPDGLFTPVTEIQRTNTVGGKKPTDKCDAHVAMMHPIKRVPYKADYVFWAPKH